MPYIDTGDKTTDIGHCRTCKGQWVVTANIKGKKATHDHTATGRVCPYCKSTAVYYTTEDNR
jgi:hypothetical protein